MNRTLTTHERLTILALERNGLDAVPGPYNCPWDVMCGNARVELKGAKFSRKKWFFNIHRHNKMNEGEVDFYVFRLEGGPIGRYGAYLVLPAPLETLTIGISIRSLLTRYAQYFNRFDLIRDCPKRKVAA